MRITCPSCQATYDVPDALLASARSQARAPAKLRCARCATEWAPVELAPALAPQPLAPTPSPFADALAQAIPLRPAVPPQAAPVPLPAEEPPPPAFPRVPDPIASDRLDNETRAPARFPPRPAAPPRTPRDAATLFFAWCVSLGVLAALLITAYVHHAEIVAFWPPAARAYDLLGLR